MMRIPSSKLWEAESERRFRNVMSIDEIQCIDNIMKQAIIIWEVKKNTFTDDLSRFNFRCASGLKSSLLWKNLQV